MVRRNRGLLRDCEIYTASPVLESVEQDNHLAGPLAAVLDEGEPGRGLEAGAEQRPEAERGGGEAAEAAQLHGAQVEEVAGAVVHHHQLLVPGVSKVDWILKLRRPCAQDGDACDKWTLALVLHQ